MNEQKTILNYPNIIVKVHFSCRNLVFKRRGLSAPEYLLELIDISVKNELTDILFFSNPDLAQSLLFLLISYVTPFGLEVY